MSPAETLRRVRTAVLVASAILCVLTVGLAVELKAPVLAGAAVGWLMAEFVNAHLCRHVDDIGGFRQVVRRHASYGIATCVGAFAVGTRDAGMQVLLLLAWLAAARCLVAAAVDSPIVQRWLGVGGQRGVLLVADRWSVADLVSDRTGRAGSFVGVCTVEGRDTSGSVAGLPVLGGPADVVDLVTRLGIHEVVVRPSLELSEVLSQAPAAEDGRFRVPRILDEE